VVEARVYEGKRHSLSRGFAVVRASGLEALSAEEVATWAALVDDERLDAAWMR